LVLTSPLPSLVIPSLFLSVILSEAKDLLFSFQDDPSFSGQALSEAKDLLSSNPTGADSSGLRPRRRHSGFGASATSE
jgi:hypothetical protein